MVGKMSDIKQLLKEAYRQGYEDGVFDGAYGGSQAAEKQAEEWWSGCEIENMNGDLIINKDK